MPDERSLNPDVEAGKQMMNQGSSSTGSKTGIKADDAALTALVSTVDKLGVSLRQRTDETKLLTTELNRAATAASQLGNAGSGGGSSGYNPGMTSTSLKSAPTMGGGQQGGGGGGQAGGGDGGGGQQGGAGMLGSTFLGKGYLGILAGQLIGQTAGQLTGGIDSRADRNRGYALPASRVGVRYQLTTGASEDQYLRARQQMANYRIDPTEMMQFQTNYGASPSASSVEGLRALSGWQKSTGGVLQDQAGLMDPMVANRMFMMTGVNAFKIGGGLNDPIKMYQQLSKRFGLTDSKLVQTARMPGSVTRAALADAGLPEEVINNLLDYAQSNIKFKEKGGLTDFDPSNRQHMTIAGVEQTYATQVEETQRTSNRREEKYMEDQLDSFAKAEKVSQKQLEMLEKIEGHLAWISGKRIENAGWMKWGGRALGIAGVGAMAFNPAVGAGLMGFGGLLAGSGDPTEKSDTPNASTQSGGSGGSNDTMVPFGYGNSKVSVSDLQSKSTFASLNPKMKERLIKLFKASGGRVGIGQGSRDPKQQESMFRDRYQPTKEKTGVYWNGTYWKHVKGAAAAPPGRSMHEIGLAADLVGDMDWLRANAGRFGLKTFGDVNNEPWHVQPSELPNSRKKYEDGGATWGTDGGFAEDATFTEDGQERVNVEHPDSGSSYIAGFGMRNYSGLSISQIIDAMQADLADSLMAGGVVSRGSSTNRTQRSLASTSTSSGALPSGASGVNVAAQAAFNAGFRGDDLLKIVAIAGRESGWKNTMRTDTSDTGIWQINWAANERHARTAGATKREDLLDPNINARAAFELYKASGFHGWKGSDHSDYLIARGLGTAGWDPNGDEMWRTDKYLDTARQAVAALSNSGDPLDRDTIRTSGGTTTISSPITISVSPQITIMSSSGTDLQSVANQVVSLIEQGVREANIRGS